MVKGSEITYQPEAAQGTPILANMARLKPANGAGFGRSTRE